MPNKASVKTIRVKIVKKSPVRPRESDELTHSSDKGRTNTAYGIFRIYKSYPNSQEHFIGSVMGRFWIVRPERIFMSAYGENSDGIFSSRYFSIWFSEKDFTSHVELFQKCLKEEEAFQQKLEKE